MMERNLAAISGWRKVVQSEFDCYTLLDEKWQESEKSVGYEKSELKCSTMHDEYKNENSGSNLTIRSV